MPTGLNSAVNTPQKLWSKHFILLCLISILMGICTQSFNTVSVLYTQSLGGSAAFGGLLLTAYTLASTPMKLLSGRLADVFGRRTIIAFGLFILAISSISFRFLPFLVVLLPLRFIQGIGFSAVQTGVNVAVTDVVSRERLGEGIGYHGLITSVSGMVGPSLALGLIVGGNYNSLFYTATAAVVIGLGVAYFLNYEKKGKGSAQHQQQDDSHAETEKCAQPPPTDKPKNPIWIFFEKGALPCAAIQFVYASATATMTGFLAYYATGINISNPGLFFTISAVMAVGVRLFAGRFSDKYGPLTTLLPGLILGTVTFVMLLLSKNAHLLYYIAGVTNGLASGLIMPTLNAAAVRNAPVHRRSAAAATYLVSIDACYMIMATVWGLVIDSAGFDVVFFSASVLTVAALVLSILFFGRTRKGRYSALQSNARN